MDKGWMSKNRLSCEYRVGVELFMQFAKQNFVNLNEVSCPCARCGNMEKLKFDCVRAHLLSKGVDRTYTTWIWHGESFVDECPMHDNNEEEQDKHDYFAREPLDDMVHDAFENTDNSKDFLALLEDAEKPLYPGCTKFTKLSAIVKLYNLKAKYSWSDRGMNDLLKLFKDMLPDNNELPPSMRKAKKSLVALGLGYEKIDACPNDCVLYRKEYKDLQSCPTCEASRWKVGRNSKINDGVSAKVLWYFPPIPRFQRMFRNKDIAKELTWHTDKRVCDGNLRHPADSPSWKLVDHQWPDFALESRNLRLALSADGINPYSTMSSTYSCWPIILITYNLPPWLCMKRKFMMLTLLIAGPKQPGNDIDVYLAPLIDDLKTLWIGVDAYDSYGDESFLLRAVLLWTINDFPAYGNLAGCVVKGYYACPVCGENTCAQRLKHSRKMSFTRHRRFLDESHPYQKQKKAFDGNQEIDPAPKPLSGADIFKKMAEINCNWRKRGCDRKSKEDDRYWKKKSIFFDLEYWKHLHIRHVLDVMHIEKNVCESLIGTLLDIPGKTEDGLAVRQDLHEMNIRSDLQPRVEGKITYLPPAPHTLSKQEKNKICSSLSGMKVPTGYSSNIRNLVSMKDLKLVGLKSHDCHTLMQHLLPVAIRGVLSDNVRYTITRLCFFFNVLCSKVIDVSMLDDMQRDIVTTLCLLEKYFPPSFFDIMVHLTVHLVREVRLCGPVWYRWMYPFERYMKVLKNYVRCRSRPEGCMAESYIAEEAVEFCSDYLSNVHTIGIPLSHQPKKLTRPLSTPKPFVIGAKELGQAHLHVLTNDADVDPYVSEHLEFLKSTYGVKSRSEKWLHEQHNKLFISWFRGYVAHEIQHSSQQISEKMKALAQGPSDKVFKYQSYSINGVTYHTKNLDNARVVQNSGVTLVAKIMQVASAKDKNPIVSDMTFYGVIQDIWELDYYLFRIPIFKCFWVDNNGIKVDDLGFTLVNLNKIGFKDDSFMLGSLTKQVFYIEDPKDHAWSVVLETPTREYFEYRNDGELEETAVHHQSFTKGLHSIDHSMTDEDEQPCICEDCDGIWVDNTVT